MKNKKLFNAIVKISLLSTILAMSFQVLPANGAALTVVSDTMTRLMISTASNHSIVFTTATAVTAGQTIKIQFDPATDAFNLGALAVGDMATTGMTLVANVGACAAGLDEVYPTVDAVAPDENVTFTVCAGDTVAAGVKSVAFNNNIIVNPAVAGSYAITIGGTMTDSGSLMVSIITNDRVVITATIDPFFTFVISSNSCGLGNLSDLAVHTCNYTLAVGTNATSGAVITIQAIDTGDGQTKLHGVAVPANNIDDSGETLVAPGTEGYGIGVVGGVAWVEQGNFATDDSSVPSALTPILSTPGPIAVGVTNAITHSAAAVATTSAGAYIQTIQYIATGTF